MEANNGTGRLFRYWLTSHATHIRLEWTADGVTQSTYGSVWLSDEHINWQYATPPKALQSAALECAQDGGSYCDVPGCEFIGWQTAKEMDAAVSALCVFCGTYESSESCLDNDGRCSKCFVAHMAETEAA